MNEELSAQLAGNTKELSAVLSRFSYEDFNRRPESGGWTPGQVAEHLLLLEIRVGDILQGPAEACDRDPLAAVSRFAGLKDITRKFVAPVFLTPSDTAKDPSGMIERLLSQRRQIAQTMMRSDMKLLCTLHPHPVVGMMTGAEWIHFLVIHATRHLQQLQQAAVVSNP